ncbi:integral membrane protein [Streptomyces griseoaurantiacus M045]|uniref:Integral membrane protein n=1 Tax=Streptomyces griseoaurantiacus M045 TaxID=996637 RepID=F3NGM3_9ACTN|nr:M56 family metallopeptidase [Streptomyces griseoaurantiacus]EGG47363.1 integral membrane protein [Streptomyces griseoaurantiacus M045]
MGVFVLLPLVLPLTAWPIARLAAHRLHPRAATRLLTGVGLVLSVCSTLCLGLLAIVGTAQLPGNPLPDAWADPQVRAAVPRDEVVGRAAIGALGCAAWACAALLLRHHRVRRRAARALHGLRGTTVAVLRDPVPYARTLPARGSRRGRIVVSTGMLAALGPSERRALFAHERAHLGARHHRHLLLAGLVARANPFLRPLRTGVAYSVERWADEEAAARVGDRRVTARAVARAALLAGTVPAAASGAALPAFAAVGPVPRRVAALLEPAPAVRRWPPTFTAAGLAAWAAAAGAAASAMSSAGSAVTLIALLRAATPL